MERCQWCGSDPLYVAYHDDEWGVPTHDDRRHFEFLVLESAQAGLSWLTILRKREGYRKAFAGFDPVKVASFDTAAIDSLVLDPAIVRNRRKIEAAVNNAGKFLEIADRYGSFDNYIWDFAGGKPVVNNVRTMSDIPCTSEAGDRLSSDLKRRGFKFMGPLVVYSHMQAVGLVNDHLVSCFRFRELEAASNGGEGAGPC